VTSPSTAPSAGVGAGRDQQDLVGRSREGSPLPLHARPPRRPRLFLLALCVVLAPQVAIAAPLRFKTPSLEPPVVDLPAHDALQLRLEGWEVDRVEAAVRRALLDPHRGEGGGQPYGVEWTGPNARRILGRDDPATNTTLVIAGTVQEPRPRDKWESRRKKKAKYGPVVVRGTYHRLIRKTGLRIDIEVRRSDGAVVHAVSFELDARKEVGGWADDETSAAAKVPGASQMATPLIDEIALRVANEVAPRLGDRSFSVERTDATAPALDPLTRGDLQRAYAAMAALESDDPWVAYDAAVLAAALRRYADARRHVAQAMKQAEEKRFPKLLDHIRDWEATDRRLVESGLDLKPPLQSGTDGEP